VNFANIIFPQTNTICSFLFADEIKIHYFCHVKVNPFEKIKNNTS